MVLSNAKRNINGGAFFSVPFDIQHKWKGSYLFLNLILSKVIKEQGNRLFLSLLVVYSKAKKNKNGTTPLPSQTKHLMTE